jgi:WD40 repeat protein
MAFEPPKVLISYSHDSSGHEKRVLELANRLRGDGIDCTIDQYVVVPAEGWPRWMDKQIRDSDFVLLVCTETYYQRVMGDEQPGKGLGVRWEGHSIYQAIYDAETMNTKFIPVFVEPGPVSHIPDPVRSVSYYYVHTENGYEDLYRRVTNQPRVVKPKLGKLRSLPPGERKSEGALGRIVNVPDLPPHFIRRPGDLQWLKDAVLAGLSKPVALTGAGKFGLQGMGGIGKTVLASALAHDSDVRKGFPDGIWWLTIGQNPNLLDLQNRLLRQLTGSKETLATELEATEALRSALQDRAALLVIDDAWTIDAAHAFSVIEPPTRLVITTRNKEVLVGLDAEEHCVETLSPGDALRLLAEWTRKGNPDCLPLEAAEVAEECGYLPLALAAIGAMIRLRPDSKGWNEALARLKQSDLAAIKRGFAGYPYPDLLRAVAVSIEALEEADRERYFDLAVFPEYQPIPEESLRLLWNLDEVNTRDCMTRLVARSLATWVTDGTNLILHDLHRDLIHKRREKDLPRLYLRLVKGWDALPQLDSYAWQGVGYHLVEAGRKVDLRQLLLNFDYLQAKLAGANADALIADYDFFPEDKGLRALQSILRDAAQILTCSPRELAGQLIGRLPRNLTPDINALRSQASGRKGFPWLKPICPSLTPLDALLFRTLQRHIDSVKAVSITHDSRPVVSGSYDKTQDVRNLPADETETTFRGHADSVNALAVTPDGRLVVSGSADNTLGLWNMTTGEIETTLEGHADQVNAVAVTPDGRYVVSGSRDRTLRVWDLATGKTKTTFNGHTDRVNAVAVTPDGRHVVSGSDDKTLRLWDAATGKAKRVFKGHTSRVNTTAVLSDGRLVVSGSDDNTIRVWDLAAGKIKRTLEGHTWGVNGVAITADGSYVISGSEDGTLRIWNLTDGTEILRFTADGQVTACNVAQDNRTIVAGDGFGRLHFLIRIEADEKNLQSAIRGSSSCRTRSTQAKSATDS